MSNENKKTTQDLLNIFSDLVTPEDVIFSRLSAEISAVLSKERVKRNMTQAEFAAFLGVKQSQISNWEHGGMNFSLKTISKLAAALNLDVSLQAHSRTLLSSVDPHKISTSVRTFTRVIRPSERYLQSNTINCKSLTEVPESC